MGYSCTAAAHKTLERLLEVATRLGPVDNSSNTWEFKGHRYFYEQGRENADGAITGTIFVMLDEGRCKPAGSLRINPDGKIVRAPHFPAEAKKPAPMFEVIELEYL